MKNYPKDNYVILENKAKEHKYVAIYSLEKQLYDACVSTACLSLINYMDALSINLFGNDNKSSNHNQAPFVLLQKLNKIGKSDFKKVANEVHATLNLKNLASYQGRRVNKKDAKSAIKALDKMIEYYNKNRKRII